ncbi:MAG: hypothetical protein EOP04_31055 [Proteobacteria bacterium]|nr:MAG: hypothetical protein EOP04_31055 [Pseudomonadota bacterium]
MSTRDKIVRARWLIIGMTGYFAGMMAPKFVEWATLPKAALAGGVALFVIILLSFLIPKH